MAGGSPALTGARAGSRGGRRAWRRRLTAALVVAVVVLAATAVPLWHRLGANRHSRVLAPARHPQLVWTRPGTPPLSDAAAAALVTPEPELRPVNAPRNSYRPTDTELNAFYGALDAEGRTRIQYSRLLGYVTGRSGLTRPTTDELIQWAAHKWGIPEDVMRAQVQLETQSRMNARGDLRVVSPVEYARYPARARLPGGHEVFQSLGLAAVKWVPGGRTGAGTEPLRWKSTAFDLDLLGARVRYYYDGDCGWCGPRYSAGQQWASVGAWFSPNPWNNAGARNYTRAVQRVLRDRLWE